MLIQPSKIKLWFPTTIMFHIAALNYFLREPFELAIREYYPNQLSYMVCCFFTAAYLINTLIVFLQQDQKSQNSTRSKEDEKKEVIFQQKKFLHNFSHEFRNPLNSIIGNIHLSLMEELPCHIRENLKSAKVCGELLLLLINNIIDRGKLEVGDLEVNPCPTRVDHFLKNVSGIFSFLIKQKKLQGVLRIHKKIPRSLNIDTFRVSQILLNMVDNSVKFTEKGKIRINLEWIENKEVDDCFGPHPYNDDTEGHFEKNEAFKRLDTQHIDIDLGENYNTRPFTKGNLFEEKIGKGVLKITVIDTGCGIQDTHKNELNSDEYDSSPRSMTRLGLLVTKELLRKMDGKIKGYSKPNVGSCFIVCIPTYSLGTIPRTQSAPELQSTNISSLVVDDSPFNVIFLSQYLAKADVTVSETASNGLEAFSKFVKKHQQGRPFQIVTMDLDMPIMDGLTACKNIRKYEKENNLSPCLLIIISGNSADSMIKQCLDSQGDVQADYFLTKPFSYDQLHNIIKTHFGRD